MIGQKQYQRLSDCGWILMLLPEIRVLHICETARGGVGTYIDTLMELELELVTSKVILPDAHMSIIRNSGRTVTFRYFGRSLRSMWHLLGVSLRETTRFRPDIIFCHSSFSIGILLVLRLLLPRTKFLYCAHGWAGAREQNGGLKAKFIRRIEALLVGLAHRVVNVSLNDLDHASQYSYKGRHVLIENAVRPALPNAPETLFGVEPELIHLLFVGRHDRQKGLDILLEAYSETHKVKPNIRLHVIGEAVVADGSLNCPTEGVNFLGWIGADRIDGYYRSADLVVVPSRWEGLPLVVLEALRNGTPVLVSDRSSMSALVERGVTGFSSTLNVKEFSKVLIEQNKKDLSAMRPACLALFSKRYHASRLGQEILALYAEVI